MFESLTPIALCNIWVGRVTKQERATLTVGLSVSKREDLGYEIVMALYFKRGRSGNVCDFLSPTCNPEPVREILWRVVSALCERKKLPQLPWSEAIKFYWLDFKTGLFHFPCESAGRHQAGVIRWDTHRLLHLLLLLPLGIQGLAIEILPMQLPMDPVSVTWKDYCIYFCVASVSDLSGADPRHQQERQHTLYGKFDSSDPSKTSFKGRWILCSLHQILQEWQYWRKHTLCFVLLPPEIHQRSRFCWRDAWEISAWGGPVLVIWLPTNEVSGVSGQPLQETTVMH